MIGFVFVLNSCLHLPAPAKKALPKWRATLRAASTCGHAGPICTRTLHCMGARRLWARTVALLQVPSLAMKRSPRRCRTTTTANLPCNPSRSYAVTLTAPRCTHRPTVRHDSPTTLVVAVLTRAPRPSYRLPQARSAPASFLVEDVRRSPRDGRQTPRSKAVKSGDVLHVRSRSVDGAPRFLGFCRKVAGVRIPDPRSQGSGGRICRTVAGARITDPRSQERGGRVV
jgi:hypothetical protein